MECAVSGTDIDARFESLPERITCIDWLIKIDLDVDMRERGENIHFLFIGRPS